MPQPDNSPAAIKDLEMLDKHLTDVVGKTQNVLLSELQNIKFELDQLRKELQEVKQQVPPKLQTL